MKTLEWYSKLDTKWKPFKDMNHRSISEKLLGEELQNQSRENDHLNQLAIRISQRQKNVDKYEIKNIV